MLVERMKMFIIVRLNLNLHSKSISTSSSLLAQEQEISFNLALEEDEDLNIITIDELSLKNLDFTCDDDDDCHQDFDMYFDFVRFRQASSPHLNETTMKIWIEVVDGED